jgi:hypothetical protein
MGITGELTLRANDQPILHIFAGATHPIRGQQAPKTKNTPAIKFVELVKRED